MEIITYLLNSWAGFYGTLIFLDKLRRTFSYGRFCFTDFKLQRLHGLVCHSHGCLPFLPGRASRNWEKQALERPLGGWAPALGGGWGLQRMKPGLEARYQDSDLKNEKLCRLSDALGRSDCSHFLKERWLLIQETKSQAQRFQYEKKEAYSLRVKIWPLSLVFPKGQ